MWYWISPADGAYKRADNILLESKKSKRWIQGPIHTLAPWWIFQALTCIVLRQHTKMNGLAMPEKCPMKWAFLPTQGNRIQGSELPRFKCTALHVVWSLRWGAFKMNSTKIRQCTHRTLTCTSYTS